jgi:hypothetical protein
MPILKRGSNTSDSRNTGILPRGFQVVTKRNVQKGPETMNRAMSYPVRSTIPNRVPDLDNLRIRLWLDVHQLQLVKERYEIDCDDILTDMHIEQPVWRDNQFWTERYQSVHGTSMLLEGPSGEGIYLVRLEVPGKVCGAMSLVRKLHFMKFLSEFTHKAMRLDACIDDFSKGVPWSELMQVRRSQMLHKRKFKFTPDLDQDDDGHIARAGSRESDLFGRMYQKSLESDGAIDSDRIEAELKGERARALWAELVAMDPEENLSEVMDLIASAALSPFEILDRDAEDETQANRLDAPKWWKDYTEGIKSWRPKLERPRTEWEKKAAWVLKQYQKTLAEIRAVYGRNGFCAMIEEAVLRGTQAFTQSNMDTIAYYAKPTEFFREHYENPPDGQIFARTAY